MYLIIVYMSHGFQGALTGVLWCAGMHNAEYTCCVLRNKAVEKVTKHVMTRAARNTSDSFYD